MTRPPPPVSWQPPTVAHMPHSPTDCTDPLRQQSSPGRDARLQAYASQSQTQTPPLDAGSTVKTRFVRDSAACGSRTLWYLGLG